MYDLHLHSTYSDGNLYLEEIISKCKMNNIKGISLTDHDTVNGLSNMKKYCNIENIEFIPGIEFGITYKGKEIHILGYFIDYKDEYIIELTNKLKLDRNARIERILNKLKEFNIDIELKDLEKYAKKDILSRAHIAQVLVDKFYVKTIKEAFDIYLGQGSLAYIEKNTYDIRKIINSIKNANGVAVLAHPGTIKDDDIVQEIIKFGIDGIEVINSKHSLNEIVKYNEICDNNKLIPTVGSDCHGKIINENLLMGNYYFNYKNIAKIKKIHEIRNG